MKTDVHFCSYVTQFLKMRNIPEKVVDKINVVNNAFSKIVPFVRCGKIL